MSDEPIIHKALFKGVLYISDDIELPCYVLDDDRRVLYLSAVLPALGMSGGGASKSAEGDRLAKFASGIRISAFLDGKTVDRIKKPFLFELPQDSKQTTYGYEATILVDLCDAVLRAREAGELQKQQLHIAKQCEILMRAFAKTGIIALIDEATGYQYYRARRALEEILDQFISEELRKWTKTFPDEFYRELFRLKGWKHSVVPLKRPGVVGTITNDIVYERLAPSVLEELKRVTPKSQKGNRTHRYHQRLSEAVGHPTLREHLTGVIALMRASSNWRQFMRNMDKAYPKFNHPEPLFYPDEVETSDDEISREGFDTALRKVSHPN